MLGNALMGHQMKRHSTFGTLMGMDNHYHLAEVREGGAGQRSHGAPDEEALHPASLI